MRRYAFEGGITDDNHPLLTSPEQYYCKFDSLHAAESGRPSRGRDQLLTTICFDDVPIFFG